MSYPTIIDYELFIRRSTVRNALRGNSKLITAFNCNINHDSLNCNSDGIVSFLVESNQRIYKIYCFTEKSKSYISLAKSIISYIRYENINFLTNLKFHSAGILINGVQYPILSEDLGCFTTLKDCIKARDITILKNIRQALRLLDVELSRARLISREVEENILVEDEGRSLVVMNPLRLYIYNKNHLFNYSYYLSLSDINRIKFSFFLLEISLRYLTETDIDLPEECTTNRWIIFNANSFIDIETHPIYEHLNKYKKLAQLVNHFSWLAFDFNANHIITVSYFYKTLPWRKKTEFELVHKCHLELIDCRVHSIEELSSYYLCIEGTLYEQPILLLIPSEIQNLVLAHLDENVLSLHEVTYEKYSCFYFKYKLVLKIKHISNSVSTSKAIKEKINDKNIPSLLCETAESKARIPIDRYFIIGDNSSQKKSAKRSDRKKRAKNKPIAKLNKAERLNRIGKSRKKRKKTNIASVSRSDSTHCFNSIPNNDYKKEFNANIGYHNKHFSFHDLRYEKNNAIAHKKRGIMRQFYIHFLNKLLNILFKKI